jgi:hypothetical protein
VEIHWIHGSLAAFIDQQGHAYPLLLSSGGIQVAKCLIKTQDSIVFYGGFGFLHPDTTEGFLTLDMVLSQFRTLSALRSLAAGFDTSSVVSVCGKNDYRLLPSGLQ